MAVTHCRSSRECGRRCPGLLAQLISSPACTLSVFEDDGRSGMQVVSFAAVFSCARRWSTSTSRPRIPGLLSAVLAALLDGQQPLLTLDEIRQSNSNGPDHGRLSDAVRPLRMGRPAGAGTAQARAAGVVRDIGGYRLRAIYYEVFTDEVAGYMQAGGYRLLNDFSGRAGTGCLGPTAGRACCD